MKRIIKTNIHLAYRVIVTQALIVFGVSLVTLGIKDIQKAYSVILGGAACILPNLYFAHHFLYPSMVRSPKKILISFFQGELVKFGLTVLLFWLMMRYLSISFLFLFIGYLAGHSGFWVAPLLRLFQNSLFRVFQP